MNFLEIKLISYLIIIESLPKINEVVPYFQLTSYFAVTCFAVYRFYHLRKKIKQKKDNERDY